MAARSYRCRDMRRWDAIIVAVYLLRLVFIGFRLREKQSNLREYFVASSSMGWLIVGISIIGSSTSTISYLSFPSEVIAHGPALLLANLAFPVSYLVVAYIFLPAYLKHNVTTIFEYLEVRFGVSVRMLGVMMFFVHRIIKLAFVVYTGAIAIRTVADFPMPAIILILGAVAIAYTTLGGVRADIIADTWETTVLFLGGIAAIAVATYGAQGIANVLKVVESEGHVNLPIISYDTTSVIGVLIWAFLLDLVVFGSDQAILQRAFCTKSLADARKSMLLNFVGSFVFEAMLCLIGFALFAYFRVHAGSFPGGLRQNSDQVFPYFISHYMPLGLSGLIIASLLAASMASLDSGINSSVAVFQIDVLGRFSRFQRYQDSVWLARTLSLIVGVLMTGAGCLLPLMHSNLLQTTGSIGGWLEGPLMAIFILGMVSKRLRGPAMIVGVAWGVVAGALFSLSGRLFGLRTPSFTWIEPVSVSVVFVVTLLLNRLLARYPSGP